MQLSSMSFASMLLEVFARFDIVGPLQVYFALLSLEGIVGTKDVGQNLTAVLMSRVTCDIARNTSALQSKRLLCSAASRVSTSKTFSIWRGQGLVRLQSFLARASDC
jgi:hypothetical protein